MAQPQRSSTSRSHPCVVPGVRPQRGRPRSEPHQEPQKKGPTIRSTSREAALRRSGIGREALPAPVNHMQPKLQTEIVAQSMKFYAGSVRRVHQYKRILVAATVHKNVGPQTASEKAVTKKPPASSVAALSRRLITAVPFLNLKLVRPSPAWRRSERRKELLRTLDLTPKTERRVKSALCGQQAVE